MGTDKRENEEKFSFGVICWGMKGSKNYNNERQEENL